MRKITLLAISSVLFLVLITGCSTIKETKNVTNIEQTRTTVKEQDVREAAYNQLTSMDKERIAGTWKDSKLSKITLEENTGNINPKSYNIIIPQPSNIYSYSENIFLSVFPKNYI